MTKPTQGALFKKFRDRIMGVIPADAPWPEKTKTVKESLKSEEDLEGESLKSDEDDLEGKKKKKKKEKKKATSEVDAKKVSSKRIDEQTKKTSKKVSFAQPQSHRLDVCEEECVEDSALKRNKGTARGTRKE